MSYEWGPVCKHTAVVLLAIQSEPPEGFKKRSKAPKIDIRPLLERAEKPQLAALILEHCREDLRFQSRVLAELEGSGEQALAAVKAGHELALIEVKCALGARDDLGRPTTTPQENKAPFMAALGGGI